ncbi:hypothetical protein HU200_050259 [Digitaria exilis]|uniref:Uncharacterized protein n=1 Tax=Digitaria exilis TaxID=1010633 RepID=A0A835EAI8_9POAL|nr:hypothetical protein HU200_050259 [Digitaria exilis]
MPTIPRVVVANKHGESLVGMLHHAGSNKVVILCHGFVACKRKRRRISVRQLQEEADDLHSVVSYLYQEKYHVTAVVGHSKGGSVVVLYASIYGDVPMVVNLSGRFYLEKGVEERLGKEFMDRINKEGYIDVLNKSGKVLYRVTKDSLMERLNTDMHPASLSISKECRFFTIHGSADKIIPVEDAYEFAKLIPNHKLHIIKKANHGYTSHPAPEQRVLVTNTHGENLVGLLHHTGSKKVVVLCHGFTASKECVIVTESEGEFQYGNYRKEADDLHSVVSYLYQEKYDVAAIVGHSKGGDVVVLYASIYNDVPMVVNLSGRFDLEKGIEERLGKEFIDRVNKEGYIDVTNKSGKFWYRVTKESLMERLNTDMRAASLSISKECRFFTIHGSADEVIPVEDAYEFAKLIPNHKLHVIEGANHCYTAHRKELCDAVVESITSIEV